MKTSLWLIVALNFTIFAGLEARINTSFIFMGTLEQPDSLAIFEEGDVFAFLTADTAENMEGIQVEKDVPLMFTRAIEGAVIYHYLSASKTISIEFGNYYWKGDTLEKNMPQYVYQSFVDLDLKPGERMKIVTVPKDFMEKVEAIDLDEQLSRLKSGDDEAFVKSMEGKRIWIIDRNTMTDSTITLVETRITPLWIFTFP